MPKCLGTLLILFFFSVGCGYHFRATGEPLGMRYESLAIPLIGSTSSEMGVEADFTEIIREEFISHGKVPIVASESAQTVLIGKLYDFQAEPLSYLFQQQTVYGHVVTHEVTHGRRLKVKLDIRLTDRATGKVIWHEKAMEEKAAYLVERDPLVTINNQRQALREIARRLSKRIYLKTMERF